MTYRYAVATLGLILLGAGCIGSRVPAYVPGDVPTDDQLKIMTDEEKTTGMEAMMAQDPSPELSEKEQAQERGDSIDRMRNGTTIRFAEFEGRALHPAEGSVRVIEENGKHRLVFSDDFSVLPGPDLYVYLSSESSPGDAGSVMGKGYEVAKLKTVDGVQVYELPDGVDFPNIHSVVIVCKPFKFIFASAGF